MFAYCLNNPTWNMDPDGQKVQETHQDLCQISLDGGIGALGIVIIGIGAFTGIVDAVAKALQEALSETYSFAKTLLSVDTGMFENHQPRVHHIIPKGKFRLYGSETVRMMNEMHQILIDANININNPANLIIVSHGSHKSMHTKDYIAHIYAIMMTAKNGTEEDVLLALFYARQYVASLDQYANGW